MRVEVYRNLRSGTWSVRHKGKVVDHPRQILIINPEFRVRPGGRERVLKEQRKNVHAFVVGERAIFQPPWGLPWREAKYNPYENETFVDVETGDPIKHARYALLDRDMQVWYLFPKEDS